MDLGAILVEIIVCLSLYFDYNFVHNSSLLKTVFAISKWTRKKLLKVDLKSHKNLKSVGTMKSSDWDARILFCSPLIVEEQED